MAVLFLDFDGVLNTDSFREEFGNQLFIPNKVFNLIKIIKDTGCKIVISSDWRFGDRKTITNAFSCNHFVEQPTDEELSLIANSIIGETLDLSGDRKEEILEFVNFNQLENWVAIDDLELDIECKHFVKCNPEDGLTESKMFEVISKLNNHL